MGARLVPHYKAEAKERQKASGGDRKSAAAKSVVKNLPQPIDAPVKPQKRRDPSRDRAGKAVNVSGRSMARAQNGRDYLVASSKREACSETGPRRALAHRCFRRELTKGPRVDRGWCPPIHMATVRGCRYLAPPQCGHRVRQETQSEDRMGKKWPKEIRDPVRNIVAFEDSRSIGCCLS